MQWFITFQDDFGDHITINKIFCYHQHRATWQHNNCCYQLTEYLWTSCLQNRHTCHVNDPVGNGGWWLRGSLATLWKADQLVSI